MTRGRKLATGNYDTREKLETEIMAWVKMNGSFAITGKIVGVSQTLVSNIYNRRISNANA